MLSTLTGLIHLLFGIYVYRLKADQKVQKFFLLLNLQLSTWLLIQGLRIFLPIEYRNLALNLNFIPISFAPFTLYVLCKKLERPESGIPLGAYFAAFVGIGYFVYNCLSQKMATLKDPENFIYDINANYHFFVFYLVFWMVLSIFEITPKVLVRRGDFKVRLFLVLAGAIFSLHSTAFFVYILPLFGIFKPSLASIGLLVSCLLWGVAILHFDAFHIKLKIIEGQDVPLINKVASGGFLRLLSKMDPMRFVQKSLKTKSAITERILIQDYELASNSEELPLEKRVQILSRKFGKYLK
ncbi:putative membrane protein [Leptospira alstonii serovar Pingchang str. 80-412]|uniref:Membrane protein n=1 Tax=Leptospira alstonii serovar Pingchang str. 80-412 TaxID=1218564 RepID=T0H8I4_9LEPT|nr:putative membrane protein [Leptospira alstonii serovar Pingchang str. 80-412]